jgi:hypothetical protein
VGLLAERLNGSWHGMQLRARLSLGASGEIRPRASILGRSKNQLGFLKKLRTKALKSQCCSSSRLLQTERTMWLGRPFVTAEFNTLQRGAAHRAPLK